MSSKRTSTSRKSHTTLKTHAQVGRIFGLAKEAAELAGFPSTQEYIEAIIAENIPSNPRISELTFDQANAIIKALGGDAFTAYGRSIRTVNYRKQAAGIKSIETEAQLKLIRSLAAERNMSDDGLARLAERMRLPCPPNTTEQGNKITEALKAMNARDPQRQSGSNVRAFPTGPQAPSPATAEPTFRRVA